MKSFIDGSDITWYPPEKSRASSRVSRSILFAFLTLVCGVVAAIYVLKFQLSQPIGSYASLVASVINTVQITIFNLIYQVIIIRSRCSKWWYVFELTLLFLLVHRSQAHEWREPSHRHNIWGCPHCQDVRVPIYQLVRVVLLHRIHRRLHTTASKHAFQLGGSVRWPGLHDTAVHQLGHHFRHPSDTDQLPGHLHPLLGLQGQIKRGNQGRGRKDSFPCREWLHADGLRSHVSNIYTASDCYLKPYM